MTSLPNRCIIVCLLLAGIACSPPPPPAAEIASPEPTEAIADWQRQKYAMFIHWGLYSIPAGIWHGEQIRGYNEQIKGHAKIPTEDYRKLATAFNPTHWDADAVASLAKAAGMKSIVITAKHHDGFCLFESAYTAFDVMDATPYKRDIIQELAAACKRQGLKLGLYFSTIDWDFPEATPFVSTVENSDRIPPLHHAYNLNQVRELMTNYGPLSEIWFDMGGPTLAQSREMAQLVKELQPACQISSRIWHDQGDFVVMGDNYQPDFKMGVPWQTPASMFPETWGYRSWQERPDPEAKIKEKLRDLINIISLGGNYLLNIGPKGDGSVVPFEKQVLEGMGAWLNANGAAIYGTEPSPIPDQTWGRITAQPGKLYLHVFDFPAGKNLTVKGLGLATDLVQAYPLADSSHALPTTASEQGLEIDLSTIEADPYVTVIVLAYGGELRYTPAHLLRADEAGTFVLTPENAERYHSFSGENYQATKPTVVAMKWHLIPARDEGITLDFKCNAGGKQMLQLTVNDQAYDVPLSNAETGEYRLHLSELSLPSGQVAAIGLAAANPENPHQGLAIRDLQIEIR